MMNKKIIGILVCMLLIAVSVSTATGTNDENETLNKKNDDYNNLIKQAVENGVISRDDWFEQDKLFASDGVSGDHFGWSVSISGDYAIIGANWDDDNQDKSGSAYIFKRSGTTWTEQAKLLASDGAGKDEFGWSVSISGDYAIIGAYGDDDYGEDSGSAYVFMRSGTTWSEQQKMVASDGAAGDYFGYSVSISGDYAIIGAHLDDDNGEGSGSAYVFMRSGSTWSEQQKMVASDGAAGDFFGWSVSISGDYAIIGADWDDDNGADSGSAYVFMRSGSTWSEQQKMVASDGAAGDWFGGSVSISGDYAIIGAPRDDDNGMSSGSAYVFMRSGSTWSEQQKMVASDGAVDDYFGYSVSISGDYAIIGAYGDDDNGAGSGSAYMYMRSGSTWSEQQKLLTSDGAAYDWSGLSVSISGEYAIIGAYGNDFNGEASGSAYVFTKDGGVNQPPETPTISGPTEGKPGQELTFIFNAADPDGDNIRFIIDWGDTTSDTTDYVPSGTDKSVSHIWNVTDTYTITAYAEDEFGLFGPEATFTVTIPRNKAVYNPFINWLQSHPNLFPLLQRLIQQQFGFGQ